MSDVIAQGLTSFWLGTTTLNLAELERYYYASQTTSDNGMLTADQAASADVTRFFKPVNYVAAVVDEPVGYLATGRVRITAGDDEVLEAWAQDYYARRIRPRLDDAIRWQGLYGESYLYLWTDKEGASRGLKVDALAPVEGGSKRVLADYGGQDPEELTAAVLYKRVPVDSAGGFDEYRITVTRESIRVEKQRLSQNSRQALGGNWQLVSDTTNTAGVLPVIPVFNPTPSDVLNMLPIQDDIDKLYLDWRMAREYAGFPTWATDAGDLPDGLQVGPGRIMYGGSYQQFAPPSITAFLDERRAKLEDAAKITKSLTLLTEAGTAPSGIALQYRQQAFLERIEGKAQRLGTAVSLALTAAARILARDPELYALETRRLEAPPPPAALASVDFDATVEPNIPSDEKGQAEVAAIWLNQLGVSRVTAWGKAGVENPEQEMLRADEERAAQVAFSPIVPGEAEEEEPETDGE